MIYYYYYTEFTLSTHLLLRLPTIMSCFGIVYLVSPFTVYTYLNLSYEEPGRAATLLPMFTLLAHLLSTLI